jgi:hypothetical protein
VISKIIRKKVTICNHPKEDIISADNNSSKKNTVYKYTHCDQIYESIILGRHPVFLTINKNNELTFLDEIEETTRIIKPPTIEEYPYTPYSFENIEEINKFITMIKKDEYDFLSRLFFKIREYVSKFIVHHDHIIDYISSLIIFSYFQVLNNTLYNVCIG